MKSRQERQKSVEQEIRRSILLSPKEKKYWLERLGELPNHVLSLVLKSVRQKNRASDTYMRAALAKDKKHQYLPELKAKIKKVKNKAFLLEEEEEKGQLDETLKKQIENL